MTEIQKLRKKLKHKESFMNNILDTCPNENKTSDIKNRDFKSIPVTVIAICMLICHSNDWK